jgi:excisionase family DNA binding protein
MTLVANRIDPSQLTVEELNRLSELMQDAKRPMLLGREGVEIPLPNAVFHVLVKIVRDMKQGKAIVLLPENESLTTKAAAHVLGMSRPFLITLLERGAIGYHKVGTHRRIYFKDIVDYQKKRDAERSATLDKVFDDIDKAGL